MFRPHRVCPPQGGLCFPRVCTAQAPGCSKWSGPCVECGSGFRVLHKSADSVAPACSVFPGLSDSGSQRLAHTLSGCGAPFPSAASGSGSQRLGRPLPGRGAPFPSAASSLGRQRLGAVSQDSARFFPPRPQRTPPVRSQDVFRQEPGPVCRVGGGSFSGAEFAPFPSPLPPSSSGDGPALWSFSVPLFCEPPAVCSGRLIFPCVSSLRLLSGPLGRSLP